MNCRFSDLRRKEVINIKDGVKYGYVGDIELDPESARLCAIIVYGRLRCFGLFGREEDYVIRWEDIQMIGDDTILVNCRLSLHRKKRQGFFSGFFSGGN